MTDEKRPVQPEAESTESTPSTPATPTATKKVAASEEPTPQLVAPSSSLVGPIETKPEEEPIPSTWDDADGSLVITKDDMEGAVASSERRTIKRPNALPPGAWVQGPGVVDLLVEGIKLMQGATRAAGAPIKEIKAVFAVAVPKAQVVLVKAVKEGTTDSIRARRDGKGPLVFNISDLLREAEMEVASGYRELYPVKKVSESPIGPCIAISMAKAVKSKRVGEKEDEADK